MCSNVFLSFVTSQIPKVEDPGFYCLEASRRLPSEQHSVDYKTNTACQKEHRQESYHAMSSVQIITRFVRVENRKQETKDLNSHHLFRIHLYGPRVHNLLLSLENVI
jgi:hypothetical protein